MIVSLTHSLEDITFIGGGGSISDVSKNFQGVMSKINENMPFIPKYGYHTLIFSVKTLFYFSTSRGGGGGGRS